MIKNRNLLYLVSALLLSFGLIAVLYQLNVTSPRISTEELASLSTCPENGPVLLTGGHMGKDEHGRDSYTLYFKWNGTGYLYFRRNAIIQINGQPAELQQLYRGRVYPLRPENGGVYELMITSEKNGLLPIRTCIYLGTLDQIYEYIRTSSDFNTFIRGMCFTVTLLSFLLFFFKPSERYLLWLALLSFFRGGYSRLSDVLELFSWLPFISVLRHETVYLVLNELLTAVLQYKLMEAFMPVRIGKLAFPWIAALAALPVLLLSPLPVWSAMAGLLFFLVLYLCYLLCILRLPSAAVGDRSLLLAAWTMTVALRFFDEFCELGWFPSGDVNLRFRLRGLVSMLFVIAFLVVVGKRFAQKFQEADELNVHLEERIRDNTRRQMLFVRSMLHNLKTPLFSLSGYSDMALHCIESNPPQARRYMEKAREKAIFAGTLMDHIFLVTQMDADMVHMQMAPVNLGHLLASVAETPTAGQENKNIQTNLDIPEDLFLRADQLYLRQAFQNILDNARVHTPDGGVITLSVNATGQGAEIHIRDSGCGIAPEELGKIFDAYYSNRHGKQQSSGLGLYIASEIVKRHGGEIQVQSTLGKGSDFTVRLPYSDIAEPSEKI